MKKLISFLLALVMCLGMATCGKNTQDASTNPTTPATEVSGGVRIITDTKGREVEIPVTVTRIVTLGSGAPRMAAYLDVMDMLVGVEDHDKEAMTVLRDYSPVYQAQIASLPAVGAGGGSGSNNGYAEQIIMAAPDVILAGFSAEAADELQAQTGIPVVCVLYTSKGLANESFYQAMRVFADVVGVQQRCEEVLAFIDACKADLNERTANIAEEAKPTAYTGAVTFSGRHGFAGTYSHFGPFDAVNAINVADMADQDGYYEADLEQIVVWDPDVIFLDPGNMNLVTDEYNTNPEFFLSLRAIQEGRVYTMPSFNNCSMNITYALMNAYYAGIVLFPNAFVDVDIAQKSGEILTFFLGENTFETMEEGGLYYGTITIGE